MELLSLSNGFLDKLLFCSVFEGIGENPLPQIYQVINNQKMFDEQISPKVAIPMASKRGCVQRLTSLPSMEISQKTTLNGAGYLQRESSSITCFRKRVEDFIMSRIEMF